MGVPKWLQSIANATIRASIADAPAVTTASGYTINSKTGEVTQDATDDPGVKQLRDNLAVLGGTATGIAAAPVVGAVVSNPVAQKLIGDTAASMLGGEVVDNTSRTLTGQSFGRGVASLFGQQNVYDRSALARFGYDALNPGYFAGNLVAKGTNAAIDAAGEVLKNADNYITIQNALRTGKLRLGESKLAPLFSKGSFTRRNPSYYIGKPKDAMFDFNIGRKSAWGYLGSKRKIATDAYNKAILERITGDPLAFQVEKLPQQRSMTPMQKPVIGTQMNDGEWVNLGDNGFFLYRGKGNEAGLTFRFKNAPEKDQMYLSTDYDLDDTAFHEYLHRGNIGVGLNGKTQWLYDWKNRSILKPGFENFRDGYLVNPEETAVNLLEIGRRADVINTPYPGFNKAKSIIQDIIKADTEKGAILDQTKWETKPKRVWDALQGKYMGLIPIGASLMLKENNNE